MQACLQGLRSLINPLRRSALGQLLRYQRQGTERIIEARIYARRFREAVMTQLIAEVPFQVL